jgi:hypothetical protein
VIDEMERMGLCILKGWPPHSSDVNIIESVWAQKMFITVVKR